jgi:hypothetical protein
MALADGTGASSVVGATRSLQRLSRGVISQHHRALVDCGHWSVWWIYWMRNYWIMAYYNGYDMDMSRMLSGLIYSVSRRQVGLFVNVSCEN